MSLSGLTDSSQVPELEDIESLLGPSIEQWDRLLLLVSQMHSPVSQVWNFGGAKHGWILRLKRKERVILYLIPQVGGFLVGLVLGERACLAAESLPLPKSVRTLLDEAPRYAEGRGFRVPVKSDEDVEAVVQLAAAKMAK